MERIGDLIPEAARRLGLEEELRLARAIATWEAIVGERVPEAATERPEGSVGEAVDAVEEVHEHRLAPCGW